MLPQNDASTLYDNNLERICAGHGSKFIGDDKKTAKVCWTCGEERRFKEAGARRADQQKKKMGKTPTEIP